MPRLLFIAQATKFALGRESRARSESYRKPSSPVAVFQVEAVKAVVPFQLLKSSTLLPPLPVSSFCDTKILVLTSTMKPPEGERRSEVPPATTASFPAWSLGSATPLVSFHARI